MNMLRLFFSAQFNRENIAVEAMIYLIIIINFISSFSLLAVSLKMPTESLYIQYSVLFCGALIFLARRISQPVYVLIFVCSVISLTPLILLFFFPINAIILSIVMNFFISFFSITKITSDKKRPSLSFELLAATVFVHSISLALTYSFYQLDNDINIQNIEIIQYQLYTHALVCVCLYIAAHQYYKFENNYGHLAQSTTQPTETIQKKLTRTVLFFVLFSIVGTPLILIFPYDLARKGASNLIRIILSVIYKIAELLYNAGLTIKTDDGDIISTSNAIESVGENSIWAQILQIIVIAILGAMLIIFVISLLTEIVRNILRLYHSVNPNKTVTNNDSVIDEVKIIERKKRRVYKRKSFGHGYEKDIRKAFYHRVIFAKKKNVPIYDSDSPLEICNKINQHQKIDITALVDKYENVRYSSETLPQNTVRHSKNQSD